MRRPRTLHLSMIVAWTAILGVILWLGTHPYLFTPYVSRLISQNLLHMKEGGLEVRNARIRLFEGIDLFGVSMTLTGDHGALTLATADTMEVDFSLSGALGEVTRLRRVSVTNPRIFVRSPSREDSTHVNRPFLNGGLILPVVILDQLEIDGADLTVTGPDGRLRERVSNLNWMGAVDTRQGISLRIRGWDMDWATHESHLESIRGEVTIDEDGVTTNRLWGSLNGHPVDVRGHYGWDKSLDLDVQGQGLSIAEVENLLDQNIGFKALGEVDATLKTYGDTLVYAGVFSGVLEGYEMKNISGRALIMPDKVVLEDMSGIVNGATFVGGGSFDIRDPEAVSFVLSGEVAQADLAKGLIIGEDDLPSTDGHGTLKIEHTDQPMWTRVTGTMQDGYIDILPFTSCQLDVVATPDSVVFNGIHLQDKDLIIDLHGSTDADEVFTGVVNLSSANLATLPASLGWPEVTGMGGGSGTLRGRVDQMTFSGRVGGQNIGLSDLKVQTVLAHLVVDNVLGAPQIAGRFSGRGMSVGGVPLGDFRGAGWADSLGNARMDSLHTVLGDTVVSLAFATEVHDSVRVFSVPHFRVELEGTPWSFTDTVGFSLGAGSFTLPPMVLSSPQGSLAVRGSSLGDSLLEGDLRLENFDLALLNPFVQSSQALAGRVTAAMQVTGKPQTPVLAIEGDLVDAPFALAHVDSLHFVGGFSQGVVDIEDFNLKSQYGRLLATGTVAHPGAAVQDFWAGASLDLDVEIPDGDWAFMEQFALPALDRLAGKFSGAIHVGGRTDDPLCQGNLQSAPFNIHWLHLDRMEGSVYVDRQTLVLGDLQGHKDQLTLRGRVEVPLQLDFLSEPVSPLDGPFYMRLVIPENSDLGPLSTATNAFADCSGRGEGEVTIAGPLDHPLYQGKIAIRDAGFVLQDLEEVYHEVSCTGEFNGDDLIIQNIDGHEGLKGRLRGDGSVHFNGLILDTFALDLRLDRFLVASIPDLAVIVSGSSGRMVGVKVGPDSLLVPRFEGSLKIDKALYSGDFSEKEGVVDPLVATVAPDWMADLHLHADPRVARIVNGEMELDMGGDLDLIRDEEGMNLRGSLDINKGRLIVFNNNFEVLKGRLDFSSELGFDPRVDIEAQTKYRLRSKYSSNSIIEHIGVQISGSLFQPVINFTSERGYSREAIQRMLLGLQPEATPEGDSGRLANTSITAGFNLLEREIAQELDIFDTFEINQIQRERDTGGMGLDPLIGVGKYIGSDLYLKYAQGIRQNDRDVLVEYQINNHLLLQSEIRRRIDENQGEPTYNLDLKYRFEY